jgi:hypothetical protein
MNNKNTKNTKNTVKSRYGIFTKGNPDRDNWRDPRKTSSEITANAERWFKERQNYQPEPMTLDEIETEILKIKHSKCSICHKNSEEYDELSDINDILRLPSYDEFFYLPPLI